MQIGKLQLNMLLENIGTKCQKQKKFNFKKNEVPLSSRRLAFVTLSYLCDLKGRCDAHKKNHLDA